MQPLHIKKYRTIEANKKRKKKHYITIRNLNRKYNAFFKSLLINLIPRYLNCN